MQDTRSSESFDYTEVSARNSPLLLLYHHTYLTLLPPSTVHKLNVSSHPGNSNSSIVASHDGGRVPRRHVEDIGFAQQVLRDPRVELDHVRDAAHGRRRHLEPLRRHQPVDALAAGRRRQGARVAVCVFVVSALS